MIVRIYLLIEKYYIQILQIGMFQEYLIGIMLSNMPQILIKILGKWTTWAEHSQIRLEECPNRFWINIIF